MKLLPKTENALVLRTDFSDDAAWRAVCAAIRQPVDGFQAYVEFVDAPAYANLGPEQAAECLPPEWEHSFLMLVDAETLSHPEHPVLVVDLLEEPGRTFRAFPSALVTVENNLSIANADFVDYAESVDADGIYRDRR